jgi:signal transduction histidine kinase
MLLRRLRTLFYTPDADDPLRVERAIGRLRVALAISALIAITADPTQPTLYAVVTYSILTLYAVAAAVLMFGAPRTRSAARWCGVLSHVIDIGIGAALTLLTDGPDSPFFLFLTFPLLTAAYRWRMAETLLTAAAALFALAIDVVLLESTLSVSTGVLEGQFGINRLIIRAANLVVFGLALGYLGDRQKQRRRESDAIAELIRAARLDAGLAGTLQSLLHAIAGVFDAERALLIAREAGPSGRTFLLDARTDGYHPGTVVSSELDESGRATYLFDVPAHSWYVVDLSPIDSKAIVALDEFGQPLSNPVISFPHAFAERHHFRSVLGVTVNLDEEWNGRLLLLNPRVGLDREESVQFAQRIVRDIGPAVRQVSVIHRLRRRAERVERLRLARELHDGPIQTLSAAVMQLQVMRANLSPQSGGLLDDLAAVEGLLRDEISNVREMTQSMRIGLLEADVPDLVRELAGLVDRFGRQSNLRAQFVSEVATVPLSTVARHELLRVVHEALVNVRKHSRASEALVWIRVFADRLILSIEDNGRGFAFDGRLTHHDLGVRHEGPTVIFERVSALGGELSVESRPGHGSRLEVRLPLSAGRAAAARTR